MIEIVFNVIIIILNLIVITLIVKNSNKKLEKSKTPAGRNCKNK